ncbi:MAG TPA: biotin/lipoyl-containing protein, partial [Bryobacteraceae bacterium]|nr:biotin/lipoyl-containing protein [Bryobacteraceae bacterium]
MTDVVMPQMGESIVEGTLTRWLKKPGERVERDEPLFEISTDKVDTEIPSPGAGVLQEVLVEEGKTVAINTIVARIAEEGAGAAPAASAAPEEKVVEALGLGTAEAATPPEDTVMPTPPPAAPTQPEQPAPASAPQQAQADEATGPLSPIVRKMAREHNLDLKQIRGTGAGGRITKADVESHLAGGRTAAPAQAAPEIPPQMAKPTAVEHAAPAAPAAAAPAPAPPAPAPAPPAPAPVQAASASAMPRAEQPRTRI